MYASEWLPYGVAFAPAGLGMVLDPFATPSDGARAVAVTLQTEAKKLFELSAVHNTVSVVPNSAQLGVRGPMVSLNLGTGLLNGSVSLSNGKFFKRVSLQGVLLQGENERALGSGLTSDGRRFVLEDATPFRGMVSVQGGVLTRNSAPLPAVAVVESFQIGKY